MCKNVLSYNILNYISTHTKIEFEANFFLQFYGVIEIKIFCQQAQPYIYHKDDLHMVYIL